MKRIIILTWFLLIGINLEIQAQQFNETSNQLQTTKEIVAPVTLLSNELRIANTFVPSDPAIGTLDNSGFGINIHKTNGIGFAFNGVHKTIIKPSGEIISPVMLLDNELRIANTFVPSDPTIGTLDNSGFGINIHKTNGIGFAFNGVHKTIIKPSGEIISPVMLLDNELRIANTFVPSDPAIGTLDNSGFGINIHKTSGIGFAFDGTHKMLFKPNGNVAIFGKLESKEIKVTLTPTADFVFDNNYNLPTLEFIENHIKEKKHLPEIASAKEMKKNGVNVGVFQIQLLQKIEELTLYTIQQEKKIKLLEKQTKEIKELKSLVKQLLESKE
ncbi:hypothetical protein J8L88_16905 [Aquimarina sp. MMG015]|uniref:hypothetical protein n=1 Tax=Aquimarina sp. MMG015 TaxID=2822689 RepID=UPI001B3A0E80|nr:hypothetical protein [Aquimarina sp. MMG015]MBQ4804543.1 hypothetical protein [Aquimarina sp. MMG015]